MKSKVLRQRIAPILAAGWVAVTGSLLAAGSRADEEVFGYVKGAEPLPKGALEIVQQFTRRSDKGTGHYEALDSKTDLEYGFTDRFSGELSILAMQIDTSGLTIDGYLPGDKKYDMRLSGVEGALKYNFLSAAKDPIGLSTYLSFLYATLDPHSGQDKVQKSMELKLLLQKYFLDDQLIFVTNIGGEATNAKRGTIDNLPAGFDWPTDPEMEIGLNFGMGVSYRFAPNWFAGVEAIYENEYETEVGLERWTVQAGPTVHYGGQRWWATLTWLPQISGGGEKYPNQPYDDLHLIEKTREEVRLKIGYNF